MYFNQLKTDVEWMLNWAHQRHEEGVSVKPEVDRITRAVKAADAQLEKTKTPSALAKREPNDLAAIHNARASGPRRIWDHFDAKAYASRLLGAWYARSAGCTLGAIVEGQTVKFMQDWAKHDHMAFPPTDYWKTAPMPTGKRYEVDSPEDYTRTRLRYAPVDDDLTYTVLGLLVLEEYGPDFTTEDVGKAWMKYLPMACTAEHFALQNLKKGRKGADAAIENNPFIEWIGADIRADPWGYAAPGWPEKAAELAWRDAMVSHRANGVYGSMYFAAAVAAAFAVNDPLEACHIALTEIPKRSRLYEDVTWALDQASKVKDYLHGRKLVDERFGAMSPVHTNNNACLTVFGLGIGGKNVTKVIGNTVAMGLDNDCTAATAGSIVGAVVGADKVPAHWYKPFKNKIRTYMNGQEWFTITDFTKRFAKVAETVWSEA